MSSKVITMLTTLNVFVLIVVQTPYIMCNDNLRVAYQWKEIDFDYRSASDREEAIMSKSFIPGKIFYFMWPSRPHSNDMTMLIL